MAKYLDSSVADALAYFDEVGVKKFTLEKDRGSYKATAVMKNGDKYEARGRNPERVATELLG